MKMRQLGDSGLRVSEVGLGCNNFGGRIDQQKTTAVVEAALAVGINFYDTADIYGNLLSEEYLGKALGERRKDVVVASKFGMPVSKAPLEQGGSRRWIMRAVEDSLRRLNTDYLDLYQFHFPDSTTPIEETLRAMDDLVTQGKVRYIGCSNFSGWQIADASWIARHNRQARFVSTQSGYSLLDRAAEQEIIPACERFGVGFLPYFPLASGMLTGKYRRHKPLPEGSRFTAWKHIGDRVMSEANFDKVEALAQWAEARDHSLLELAFGWLLGRPIVSSVIAGATSAEQVQANVAAAQWVLTPEEVTEVSKLVDD